MCLLLSLVCVFSAGCGAVRGAIDSIANRGKDVSAVEEVIVLPVDRVTHGGDAVGWKTVSPRCLFAIKSDGSLWAWGNNSQGQLGDGTRDHKDAPVRIGTDTDWKTISTGAYHSLALKADGSLWAWGNNSQGQLGDGTRTYSDTGSYKRIDHGKDVPTRIDTGWKAVSAGSGLSLAIERDGSLWAWGGGVHPMAASDSLPADGSLWAWGGGTGITSIPVSTYPTSRRRSQGTEDNAGTTPIRVCAGTGWKAVGVGSDYFLALKADGMLWVWRHHVPDADGEIWAWGSNGEKTLPVRIGTDADWKAVGSSLAIKSDGSLWEFEDTYGAQQHLRQID